MSNLHHRLIEDYRATRARTEALAAPLSAEDQMLQSMPDCSPTKWHRAHTSWFFETFVLLAAGVGATDPRNAFLWNSYYDAIGERHPRPQRGLLSRPSADDVTAYRAAVDARVIAVLSDADDALLARLAPIVTLGLAHEQQHQELILTDILHALSRQPFDAVYAPAPPDAFEAGRESTASGGFTYHDGGLVEIGHAGDAFAFDNEGPRHRVWLEPFALADRPITVGEVRAFIADGGYRTPSLWLAAGWEQVCKDGLDAPLHASVNDDGGYTVFTLHGRITPPDNAPASHLSHYEADAIARWLGGRLPTEHEWEHAARQADPARGQFAASGSPLTPTPSSAESLFGGVWQWTASAYSPYPGFAPGPGAIGEYNGKFMANQYVLRGGSCLTPPGHIRISYRNFWPSATRFQMTGARIARGPEHG